MKTKISEKIKELLIEKGITAYKLAKDLKISKSVLHYWINGRTTPNIEKLVELAVYFDVTTDYLLGLEDETGAKYVNSFNNANISADHNSTIKF